MLIAWKVLLALQEKKLPYNSNLIEFSKQQHKTPEFLQMNPRGIKTNNRPYSP